jgi:hypothetical protein
MKCEKKTPEIKYLDGGRGKKLISGEGERVLLQTTI